MTPTTFSPLLIVVEVRALSSSYVVLV
jgi:hypothetical protein